MKKCINSSQQQQRQQQQQKKWKKILKNENQLEWNKREVDKVAA